MQDESYERLNLFHVAWFFGRDRSRLSHHPGFFESNGYNHRDQFERLGFHFLHDAPAVFLDGANRNS
jgi:hypothetical protein